MFLTNADSQASGRYKGKFHSSIILCNSAKLLMSYCKFSPLSHLFSHPLTTTNRVVWIAIKGKQRPTSPVLIKISVISNPTGPLLRKLKQFFYRYDPNWTLSLLSWTSLNPIHNSPQRCHDIITAKRFCPRFSDVFPSARSGKLSPEVESITFLHVC